MPVHEPSSQRQLLSTAEAAERLGLQQQTLRKWRVAGCGPRYVRLTGTRGRVGYRPEDVAAWLAERVHSSTSEEHVAAAAHRGGGGRRS